MKNFDLSILKLQIAPSVSVKNYEYNVETAIQKDGEILITLKSTYAGEHIVAGALLPLANYYITFTHGEPSADNSILEVSKKVARVGEIVNIYITPYDKYFNLIDANEYKEISPYQVKYTNEGSVKITLNSREFIIKDTWIWIKKENLEKVWDRFWQEDSSKTDITSFGLWLYLVKLLVEKHWWNIEVKSTQWKWSEFRITF